MLEDVATKDRQIFVGVGEMVERLMAELGKEALKNETK